MLFKTRIFTSQWLLLLSGFLFGLITVVASVGLLALAGYLICSAAFAGLTVASAIAFNYLLPAAGIRFFAMVRIGARYGDRVLTHEATFKILSQLRLWFYQQIEPLAPAHLLRHNSAELLNRAVSDIDALDNLYIRVISPLIIAIILTLLIFFFIHYFNLKIATMIATSMFLILIVTSILMISLGKKPGIAIINNTAKLRTEIISFKQNLSDILLFNQQNIVLNKIQAASKALINHQQRMSQLKGLSHALVSLACSITIWLALFWGIPLVHFHLLNGANLGLIILAILAAFEVIMPIPVAFQYLSHSLFAGKRLLDISGADPVVKFVSDSRHEFSKPNININNISFKYPNTSRLIFDKFNLTIPFKNKVAIIGSTGCGKSTLIQLIARVFDPNHGGISLNQNNLKTISEESLRNTICVTSQSPHIFNMSIRDNLLIGNPKANDEDLFQALKLVHLYDLVMTLPQQLNTVMGEFGQLFSGGECKRFAIARAILNSAPIMILDEPSESLNPQLAKSIWKNLLTLWKNKTIIVVSHQLQWLDGFDQVINCSDL